MDQRAIVEKLMTTKNQIMLFLHEIKCTIYLLFDKDFWTEIYYIILEELCHCQKIIKLGSLKFFLFGIISGLIVSKIFIWILGDLQIW